MKNEFTTIAFSNGEMQTFATDLKELELNDNLLIENIEAFILLQDLEKIIITNSDSILDLSPKNNVLSQRRLKCRFQNLETLKALKDNLNLKVLSLSERNSLSRFYLLDSDFLIVKFISPKRIDLSSIEALFQITNLEIFDANYLHNIESIGKLKNLQCIRLFGWYKLSDISPLKDLNLLKELELAHGCDKIRNIESAFEIKSLDTLIINSCSGIENIKIKNNNFSLKSLVLSECINLRNINEIYKLKLLNKLQIESDNNLEDFSVVKKLTILKELVLLKNLNYQSELLMG